MGDFLHEREVHVLFANSEGGAVEFDRTAMDVAVGFEEVAEELMKFAGGRVVGDLRLIVRRGSGGELLLEVIEIPAVNNEAMFFEKGGEWFFDW